MHRGWGGKKNLLKETKKKVPSSVTRQNTRKSSCNSGEEPREDSGCVPKVPTKIRVNKDREEVTTLTRITGQGRGCH